jgi:hypothetical protein
MLICRNPKTTKTESDLKTYQSNHNITKNSSFLSNKRRKRTPFPFAKIINLNRKRPYLFIKSHSERKLRLSKLGLSSSLKLRKTTVPLAVTLTKYYSFEGMPDFLKPRTGLRVKERVQTVNKPAKRRILMALKIAQNTIQIRAKPMANLGSAASISKS